MTNIKTIKYIILTHKFVSIKYNSKHGSFGNILLCAIKPIYLYIIKIKPSFLVSSSVMPWGLILHGEYNELSYCQYHNIITKFKINVLNKCIEKLNITCNNVI